METIGTMVTVWVIGTMGPIKTLGIIKLFRANGTM